MPDESSDSVRVFFADKTRVMRELIRWVVWMIHVLGEVVWL